MNPVQANKTYEEHLKIDPELRQPWKLYIIGNGSSNHSEIGTGAYGSDGKRYNCTNRIDRFCSQHWHEATLESETTEIKRKGTWSISDEEFKQAIKEVLQIVKNYNHEITIIECDNEIRRTYKVKSVKDIKERINIRGGTKFTPVFEYANKKKLNLLVYFTDGKGEDRLEVIPRGYKVLWVISGRGDKLSLNNPYGAVKKLSKVEVKEDTIDMSDVRDDGYSMNNQQPML